MAVVNGTHANDAMLELDALIVGAGFGGVYQLKKLRDHGWNVKLVKSGSDFGVWHWNRYPGARVDIATPLYEFSDPELWTDWNWTQRFPGSAELRAYFQYVADKWDLRGDSIFDTNVKSAVWDDATEKWTIRTNTATTFRARFFLPNIGFAAKRYIPDWKGLQAFEGTFLHPSYWPKDEPDLRGKRIAVIGTGSTGVQLTQALAPLASEFTLFQRTPNLAIPMGQVDYQGEESGISKANYAALYAGRTQSFGGVDYDFLPVRTFDHDPEERKKTYEKLWAEGDFHFWVGTYHDTLFDDEANTEAYNFWRDKVRARLHVPRLREKLAPMTKPYAFGCKRVALENGFYELLNDAKNELVDLNDTPVLEFTEKGIRTTEKEREFDYIICATGFDAVTGGFTQMNVVGKDGISLNEKWKDGVKTNLGLCVSGFPNMLFTYGPQAPTALCNGPSCAELQGDWVVTLLNSMREKKLHVVDASPESERKWAEGVWALANMSLLPKTKSGDNIPGKTREPLMFLGGVPFYYKTIQECAANGYDGFELR